ncbi:hypothetical protein EYF80_040470 [Liparis tanakae]|uniref:Uncharacterized protein n=1 Tax=Liparis tanakae TaxID=230148 RepID=A0A4Z2G899_9TELE|nr:hypothetical protein EYF80_040470 [Liparis tanakae]
MSATAVRSPLWLSDRSSKRRRFRLNTPSVPSPLGEEEEALPRVPASSPVASRFSSSSSRLLMGAAWAPRMRVTSVPRSASSRCTALSRDTLTSCRPSAEKRTWRQDFMWWPEDHSSRFWPSVHEYAYA